jgi:hypothetical protein
VGFVLGCLFAFGVQHRLAKRDATAVAPSAKPAANSITPPPAPAPTHASLAEIENVFTQYATNAVWRHDLTEVALWRPETNKYSELFEVLRNGDVYYFRTIPQLTRPVVKPNLTPDLPLRFTEPEDVQLKRLQENSSIWLPPSTNPNR